MTGFYMRATVAVMVIGLATAAGWWLGDKWDTFRALWTSDVPAVALAPAPTPAASRNTEKPKFDPPLYYYAAPPAGADMTAVVGEVVQATSSGINQYILSVPLPWTGRPAEVSPALERLDALLTANPAAKVVLQVNMNPMKSWLDQHASATVTVMGESRPYPCVASTAWLSDAQAALNALVDGVKSKYAPEKIQGYLLGGLEEGRWYRTDGPDACQDNVSGFRLWLRLRYANDAALQEAWGSKTATLDGADIPEPLEPSETKSFVDLPAMQQHVDFLQYTSDSIASAIVTFADTVKEHAPSGTRVFVPYGYTFELTSNDGGHLALARLLESSVDVFVSPVSYSDRGVGGSGGFMGPVDSVLGRGKQWLLIDDTRTTVAAPASSDAASLAVTPIPDDVFNVQKRNFAAAVSRGLPLSWAAPEGGGRLAGEETWRRIASMCTAYKALYEQDDAATGLPNEDVWKGGPSLMVVIDESSRMLERADDRIGAALLREGMNVALRAGIPTRFCLLQDVLRDQVPPATVYWFLNAFRLSAEQRTRLHEILQREKAAAIWMYAPGYFEKAADTDHISSTVLMTVKAMKGAAVAGSQYVLAGKWADKDEVFGNTGKWDPLFYIDDEEASVLARYADSKKSSAAVKYCEEGWTSVYVAEPAMTPSVLREILELLDQQPLFRKAMPASFDPAYFGPEMVAIHAQESGERSFDLGRMCDVTDLLDPQSGWPRTRSVNLTMHQGETRIFRLRPLEPVNPASTLEPSTEPEPQS